MQHQKFKINGKPYNVGFSFRAVRNYEQMTGESISECKSTWDNLIYFYCSLQGLNDDFTMSFDDFVDYLDQHPELLADFQATEAPETEAPQSHEKKSLTLKEASGLWTLMLLLSVSPVLLPIISLIGWLWMSWKLLGKLIAKIGKKPVSPS